MASICSTSASAINLVAASNDSMGKRQSEEHEEGSAPGLDCRSAARATVNAALRIAAARQQALLFTSAHAGDCYVAFAATVQRLGAILEGPDRVAVVQVDAILPLKVYITDYLRELTGTRVLPVAFAGGKFIGTANRLHSLQHANRLEAVLAQHGLKRQPEELEPESRRDSETFPLRPQSADSPPGCCPPLLCLPPLLGVCRVEARQRITLLSFEMPEALLSDDW